MLFSSSIDTLFFVYWTGVLVPQNVKEIVKVDSKAMFILLVEKDAAFQKLLDDGAQTRFGPCIIITVCFVLYFCSNCSNFNYSFMNTVPYKLSLVTL